MNETAETIVGECIKNARIYRKYNRKYVATELGVSESLIQQYENGKTRIPVSSFLKICKVINIDAKSLLAEVEENIENKVISCGEKYNIVVIEDNVIDQMIIRDAITSIDIDSAIHNFQNGQEGIDFIRKTSQFINIIILDINIPKRNGIEVLRTIKGDTNLRDIPVVMITSSNMKDDIELCHKYGCDGYIVKNFNKENFLNDIVKVVRHWTISSMK